MLNAETLLELLARKDFNAKQKLLLCLAIEPAAARKISEIKELAVNSGLRDVRKWNVSDYLRRSKPNVARINNGWVLTDSGRSYIRDLIRPILLPASPTVISTLREELSSISNPDCRAFVAEAISAFEAELYKSAIVFSWIGAVAVLYDHIVKNKLNEFNLEAERRNKKWNAAKTSDDLARITEYEFLQILFSISVIGKSVKTELEKCLQLRNGCGHPNSLVVGTHKASAHIETLLQNVFAKF